MHNTRRTKSAFALIDFYDTNQSNQQNTDSKLRNVSFISSIKTNQTQYEISLLCGCVK